jgi:hypothetical protein
MRTEERERTHRRSAAVKTADLEPGGPVFDPLAGQKIFIKKKLKEKCVNNWSGRKGSG